MRCLTATVLLAATVSAAADRIVVPLEIEKDYRPPVQRGRLRMLAETEAGREARAPGGTRVWIQPKADAPGEFQVVVDTNEDGLFSRETPVLLTEKAPARVWVIRRWANGRSDTLPYDLRLQPRSVEDDQPEDVFRWLPAYRSRGTLKIGSCATELGILDYDGNGIFDARDSDATTLSLARERNGRPAGGLRWLHREAIIEYCDRRLLLESVEPDGSAATFIDTELRVPRVGEVVPAFSLVTTDGKVVSPETLTGKVTLLDFWASWCVPCVEKFPAVKALSAIFDKLQVIAVNVDDAENLPSAREAVARYELPWPNVMNGKPDDDPAWKMLGAIDGNAFVIPQYVLLRPDGRIAYAGRGGDDLKDLRARIQELLAAPAKPGP
jgi:thiol-disulfide isomerase/thioredoxin